MPSSSQQTVGVLVIGGGVNGTGIARDACGRGLSVVLCEQDDLASGTSSKATKLFHGGLRYLEHYDFRLVRKALIERGILLKNMPHISRPMRFVLPHSAELRPAWLLRIGLFIYDHLGGRKNLPATRTLKLRSDPAGAPLKKKFRLAFEYSDGWVDDARLVVLNARDAADRGASILTRTKVEKALRKDGVWSLTLKDMRTGNVTRINSKTLVNAAGPWVNEVVETTIGQTNHDAIRLVRGSHIVVGKLFDHDRAYFFQNRDGRIIFAIPYEGDFTLIGTTDVDHQGSPADPKCTEEEKAYLCKAASEYFENPVTQSDIVWHYSGVRPLDDDLGAEASGASRDYHINVEDKDGTAPLISIYGGKITTFRKLAEEVVAELAPYAELSGHPWTDHTPLPGGDFAAEDRGALENRILTKYPFLSGGQLSRMTSAYGTRIFDVLGDAANIKDMGDDFGGSLFAREVSWLVANEWAETADDIIWRRTKCGLRMTGSDILKLENWLKDKAT